MSYFKTELLAGMVLCCAVSATCAARQAAPDDTSTLSSVDFNEMEVGPNVGTQPTPPSPAETVVPGSAEPSRFHFSMGVDYTTAYFGRGLLVEKHGLILQLYADASFDVYRTQDATVSLTMGTWNSYQDRATAAGTGDGVMKKWYESDLYAGAALTMGELEIGARYYFYTSPSDAYGTIEEAYFSAAYDDSELMGEWSMSPTVVLAIETGANAADGGANGTYLQLGVAPAITFDAGSIKDVEVSFPASVGLSLGNYYQGTGGENDFFGFASVGSTVTVPLNLDASWGSWNVKGGVQALVLGDAAGTFNNGDTFEVIGTVGVSVEF
jgi:hypothetical protein